jgi:hypothetical protein
MYKKILVLLAILVIATGVGGVYAKQYDYNVTLEYGKEFEVTSKNYAKYGYSYPDVVDAFQRCGLIETLGYGDHGTYWHPNLYYKFKAIAHGSTVIKTDDSLWISPNYYHITVV